MMPEEDKQVTLTAAWLFMQHGQTAKAKAICRAVSEVGFTCEEVAAN